MAFYVEVDGEAAEARWLDDASGTRSAVEDALPVEGDATKWGCELYFSVPVDVEPEDPVERVPEGAVAYWPEGDAVCLFWGGTPASEGDEPRAAGPVDVVGVVEDTSVFEDAVDGSRVRLLERSSG